ncbi:bifunctional diguanylate cyclase/phosphodiesterase [Komagataeibacter saccharivorans]|uniref:putative bifunctional diguanylate cyclase/phosphodiesterase n=1 Tax=Komagataeibacter saccharivorans TaxID=265959 RepID=UPI0024A80C8A|nr:EAL domain-containing protein [Komagataeibacter saccharivorans]
MSVGFVEKTRNSFLSMGDIAKKGPIVRPDDPGECLFTLFRNDEALLLVTVINTEDEPVGLVERQAFFLKVSGKFGHALFSRRPVALLMDASPVIIDAQVSSSDFTALALRGQASDLLRGYIVTENGRYLGTGSALDLISASHSNAIASAASLKHSAEELRKANRKILRDKLFIDTIIENIPSALIVRSIRHERPVLVNRAAEHMIGCGRELLLRKNVDNIFCEDEVGHFLVNRPDVDQQGEAEKTLRNNQGHRRVVSTRRVMITDESDAPRWELCVADDVTEQRNAQHQVEQFAHYDPLTGLANRALFSSRLNAGCRKGLNATLLCIDLDYFKTVNDVYGHATGDALLRLVAARLRACSREEDLVARLGGDEFAIIWPAVPTQAELKGRAREIVETVGRPYIIDGHHIVIGASIGAALYPFDADSSETLLQYADIALYRAKSLGRNGFQLFDAELRDEIQTRARLGNELRAAIANDELTLHFQPLYTMPGNRICACEALTRWQHPVQGMIPPDQFIGLAEENGLIHDLGEWVLRAACREAATWPEHLKVAVNVSPIQLRNPRFVDIVECALQQAGLEPARLEIEITENIFVQNSATNRDILQKLGEMGCGIVLDDFGTGYSSLGYLRSFRFQKIKIDRSFVRELPEKGASSIIQAIINLAHGMDIPITAEGVETQDQWAQLNALGCNQVQGFLLGRPQPADSIRQHIQCAAEMV